MKKLMCLFLMLFAYPAQSEMIPEMTGAGASQIRVKSFSDMRFRNMIKQHYDFSCGSAALASLLTYHYERPISEEDVLTAMYEAGDQGKIAKVGFSMMDMKNYLQSIGLKAEGYRVPLDKLNQANIPGIALINSAGYMHFVVVKGVKNSEVLLGDPAKGTRAMPRDEFNKTWNGILFVIQNEQQIASRHFNKDWQKKREGEVVNHEMLSNITLDTSFTPNYY